MLRCLRDFDLDSSVLLKTRSPSWHCCSQKMTHFMHACDQASLILSTPSFWVLDLLSVILVFVPLLIELSTRVSFVTAFHHFHGGWTGFLSFPFVKPRQCIFKVRLAWGRCSTARRIRAVTFLPHLAMAKLSTSAFRAMLLLLVENKVFPGMKFESLLKSLQIGPVAISAQVKSVLSLL